MLTHQLWYSRNDMGVNPVMTEKLIIAPPFKCNYLVLKFIHFYMY